MKWTEGNPGEDERELQSGKAVWFKKKSSTHIKLSKDNHKHTFLFWSILF